MPEGLVIPAGHVPGETWKARERRIKTGWMDRYAPCSQSGIDIGCQRDPLNATFRRWDIIFGDGDATFMEGVPDEVFYTVYCSHVIEHLDHPTIALRNWYRILRPGGHLIVVAPHRDLYEKKESPPSNWNHEHKWFFVPSAPAGGLPTGVLALEDCIRDAIPDAHIVSYEILSEGYIPSPANVHSCGEYSIEAIVRKPSGSPPAKMIV